MTKSSAAILMPLLLLAGCGVLTDVTLGAGTLPAVDVDRVWRLGSLDLETCPVGHHQVLDERSGDRHALEVVEVPGGCGLTFLEPDLVLFDEAGTRDASEALDGRRIDAVQAAAVEVSGFSLTDGGGGFVDVDTITSLRMTLGDALVLDHAGLDRLQAGETVRSDLPPSLLDRILDGLNRQEAVRADAAVVLEVPDEALADLPDRLHLRMRLQPEVTVDILEFIGG